MSELLYSCYSDLDQAATPTCGTDYGERVVKVIMAKTNLWAGVPTPLQINTAWLAGTISVIGGIVNGHRTYVGGQEIEVVYKEVKDKLYRIDGRLVRFDASIQRMTEKLNRYGHLYVWYLTDKNYCFGAYDCSVDFSLTIMDGKGARPYISFAFEFIDMGIDLAAYDAAYEVSPSYTIPTADYVLTEDDDYFETEDGQIIINE